MNDKVAFTANAINRYSHLMEETERRKPSNNAGPLPYEVTSSWVAV